MDQAVLPSTHSESPSWLRSPTQSMCSSSSQVTTGQRFARQTPQLVLLPGWPHPQRSFCPRHAQAQSAGLGPNGMKGIVLAGRSCALGRASHVLPEWQSQLPINTGGVTRLRAALPTLPRSVGGQQPVLVLRTPTGLPEPCSTTGCHMAPSTASCSAWQSVRPRFGSWRIALGSPRHLRSPRTWSQRRPKLCPTQSARYSTGNAPPEGQSKKQWFVPTIPLNLVADTTCACAIS